MPPTIPCPVSSDCGIGTAVATLLKAGIVGSVLGLVVLVSVSCDFMR